MIRKIQPNRKTVSKNPNKKRQANSVIHVSFGLQKRVCSIKTNKIHPIKSSHSQNVARSNHSQKNSSLTNQPRKLHISRPSIKNSHCENPQTFGSIDENISIVHKETTFSVSTFRDDQRKLADSNGMIMDHHLKPKEKKLKTIYLRRFCVAFSMACIVVSVIITIILLVLLIKPTKTQVRYGGVPVLRWNSTGITVAGGTGSSANMSRRLFFPFGITLDYANNLYIADYGMSRVQKYLFGSSTGETIAGNTTNSLSLSNLANPSHVIMDENGDYYITDHTNNRTLFWPKDAISGTIVAGTGSPGIANNQLDLPYGIALHPTNGTLYVADFLNSRLMAYEKGASSGTQLLGYYGLSNTSLASPVGLHYDAFTNSLIITNHGTSTVVKYPIGGNAWTLLAGNINGIIGNTSTTFNYAIDAVFDPMGNLYVADRFNYRIQFYQTGELTGSTIAGITGVSGSSSTTLSVLSSLALDSQLNLYVADSANNRIQKFLRY